MKVVLENVRTFSQRHYFPIRPLTILIGENSSGKTTFLAMLAALFGEKGFPGRPSFNEPPYDLGSYDTIATYRGRRPGRAKHFSIGYIEEEKNIEVVATYARQLGEPNLREFSLAQGQNRMRVSIENQELRGKIALQVSGTDQLFESSFERSLRDVDLLALLGRSSFINIAIEAMVRREQPLPQNVYHELFRLLRLVDPVKALSVAPIRTKPKRTYDEMRSDFDPGGDHIPLVLDRALGSLAVNQDEANRLKNALERFGETSGLFTRLRVKKLGKNQSDPFQIMVSVDRQPFNLSDVGYGISQSLPVVVQSVLRPQQGLLLVQQPEVHLHPRAQAALGSFFSELAASTSTQFVIETHSDFLVDRVRQEVAKRTVPSESVSIMFFARNKGLTRVHPLSLDDKGNLVGAPPRYRQFFLKEETALLSRANE